MVLLAMLMPVLVAPAHAAYYEEFTQNERGMRAIDKGTIVQILKSDMIMLDDNKRYRLENVLVPPFEDAPAVEELKQEFLNKPVTIYAFHDVQEDQEKYGVPYAHIVNNRGMWVQQDLISKGLAWALCTDTSPQTADILKQTEEKARVDHQGFWKDPAYAIKTPDNIGDYLDSYQIVEGQISYVSSKSVSGYIDFNFGKGKKRKFAIRFENDTTFQTFLDDPITGLKNRLDFTQWQGRTVRVRGWVKDDGAGPVIVLTRPEQVDVVMMNDK
jgi:hypothetical protein